MLECIPHKDWDTFAWQYIADDITATNHPHPCSSGVQSLHGVSRLAVPQETHSALTPSRCQELVEYHIPLEKACLPAPPYFPQGSISQTTLFEIPVDMPTTIRTMNVGEAFRHGTTMGSVKQEVSLPQVYGLKGDEGSFVCVMRAAVGWDVFDNPSLMDCGAKICITGILSLFVDVVSIPPSTFLVATTLGSFLLDDCCTKRGLILLTLSVGLIFYQPCYDCKNAPKTIISPEAILAASDTCVHWNHEGHKEDAPGSIQFMSSSGLYSITLELEKQDGLYYCSSDVFTVDHNLVRSPIPVIQRIAAHDPLPLPKQSKQYVPVTQDCMTKSQVWMLHLGSPGEQQLDILPGNVTGIPLDFLYHPF
jgi:hypothetical protein